MLVAVIMFGLRSIAAIANGPESLKLEHFKDALVAASQRYCPEVEIMSGNEFKRRNSVTDRLFSEGVRLHANYFRELQEDREFEQKSKSVWTLGHEFVAHYSFLSDSPTRLLDAILFETAPFQDSLTVDRFSSDPADRRFKVPDPESIEESKRGLRGFESRLSQYASTKDLSAFIDQIIGTLRSDATPPTFRKELEKVVASHPEFILPHLLSEYQKQTGLNPTLVRETFMTHVERYKTWQQEMKDRRKTVRSSLEELEEHYAASLMLATSAGSAFRDDRALMPRSLLPGCRVRTFSGANPLTYLHWDISKGRPERFLTYPEMLFQTRELTYVECPRPSDQKNSDLYFGSSINKIKSTKDLFSEIGMRLGIYALASGWNLLPTKLEDNALLYRDLSYDCGTILQLISDFLTTGEYGNFDID